MDPNRSTAAEETALETLLAFLEADLPALPLTGLTPGTARRVFALARAAAAAPAVTDRVLRFDEWVARAAAFLGVANPLWTHRAMLDFYQKAGETVAEAQLAAGGAINAPKPALPSGAAPIVDGGQCD